MDPKTRPSKLLIVAAFGVAVFMIAPQTSPLFSSSRTSAVAPKSQDGGPTLPTPTKAKGIIVSGYSAGGERLDVLVDLVKRTELNTLVVDIKDEAGEVSWVPVGAAAKAVGAGVSKIDEPKALIAALKAQDIYVIGRIVVFKDPILAKVRPDLAVKDAAGGIWKDRRGAGWGNPFAPEVWDYNMALAEEAADLGFDEIQFDYIRFPTDGKLEDIRYSLTYEREQAEIIRSYIAIARERLHAKGVFVSVDLFGFVTLVDDPGIGQRLELIANEVDFVSLMLYPSHYQAGNLGLTDPIRSPSETISRSLTDALRITKGKRAKLRPWLQDFSIHGVPYTPTEVRAQIKAAEALGVNEWLLWNANNKYSEDALRPKDWDKKAKT